MKISSARVLMYEVCLLSDGQLTWPVNYTVGELMNFVKLAPKLTGVDADKITEAFTLLSERFSKKERMVVNYKLLPEIEIVKKWINYFHGRKVAGYLRYDCSMDKDWKSWLMKNNLLAAYEQSHDDYFVINVYRESDGSLLETLPIVEFEEKYNIKHRDTFKYMTKWEDSKPKKFIKTKGRERLWMQRECDRRVRMKEWYC